jgi:hypothetical protein
MLTARQCAAALGISEKNLSVLSRRDGFPRAKKKGRRYFYDDPPTAQRKWIEENIRSKVPLKNPEDRSASGSREGSAKNHEKKPRSGGHGDRSGRISQGTKDGGKGPGKVRSARVPPSAGRGDHPSATVEAESEDVLFTADDPSILALESQAGSAVTVSRSILSLASRDLARRFKKGNVGATQLDALNKTLQRLVAVEADALKTAERMGMLMHREAVERVVGVLADRFIRAFGRLEAEIATEALLWRKMEAMPAAEYRRKVREFVQKHAREIRAMEAAEIEAITKKEA